MTSTHHRGTIKYLGSLRGRGLLTIRAASGGDHLRD